MSQQRCVKCILSTRFPRIKFDEKGVCNFCRNQLYITTETETINKSRKLAGELFDRFRGNSQYDAVVCFSGGKDSTYTLMLAREKYDLKVLALTVDNGFLSPMAFDNVNRTVDALGVDLVTIRPSGSFFVPLVKESAFRSPYNSNTLARVSSVCNSCISIINISALRLALEKGIPFILAGFTLGQIPSNSIVFKNNYNFLMDSREGVLKQLRARLGAQVDEYFCLREELIEQVDEYPSTINILCLEDIEEAEIYRKIKRIGWSEPKDVDGCSSNCRLNAFNNYIHQKLYGFHPYELELSHLIRRGQLTRAEALNKIETEVELKELEDVLELLKVTPEELDSLQPKML